MVAIKNEYCVSCLPVEVLSMVLPTDCLWGGFSLAGSGSFLNSYQLTMTVNSVHCSSIESVMLSLSIEVTAAMTPRSPFRLLIVRLQSVRFRDMPGQE